MIVKCFAIFLLIGSALGRGLQKRETEEHLAMKQLKTTIEKYCDEIEVADIQKSAMDTAQCFMDTFEQTFATNLYTATAQRVRLDEAQIYIDLFKGLCGQKTHLMKCYNDFLDVLAPCVRDKGDVPTAKKLMSDMFDYVCYNDTQRVIEFIRNDGVLCISEQSEGLHNCTAKIDDEKIEQTKEMSLSQACELYDDLTGCVVKNLDKCAKKSAAEFFTGLFEIVSESQCSGKQQ